jgi:hypothetical protein
MKYIFFLAVIGGAVWFLYNRPPQIIERVVEVTPAPSTPSPSTPSRTATPSPPSLATLIQPAYARVFGAGDNAPPILGAKTAVQELPAKLNSASDAVDPRKLNAAIQVCQLMVRAITDTDAALREKQGADKPNALDSAAPFGVQTQARKSAADVHAASSSSSFFGGLIEKQWRDDIDRLRNAASPLAQSLGAPDPASVLQVAKFGNAQRIQCEVVQAVNGGALADLYESYVIADYSRSVGMGGYAATGYRKNRFHPGIS